MYTCKRKKKLALWKLFQDRMTLMIGMSGGLQNKDMLVCFDRAPCTHIKIKFI